MSWHEWADQLRRDPLPAVEDLLRGTAEIAPFDRAAPYEFLLAILPRNSRFISESLLGEPVAATPAPHETSDLPAHLDSGLSAWLQMQREAPLPPARKLGAYAVQVCEALQWPLYFALPETSAGLKADRPRWLKWLGSLTMTANRDPEYDYWQVLATQQTDDTLQSFWYTFVLEAGRIRSLRYLNLGLLALARLPLSEDDSLRNLRLQVHALVNRAMHRKNLGISAAEELAQALRGVMARNPSMGFSHYQAFLREQLAPLGDDKIASVLGLLGLSRAMSATGSSSDRFVSALKPPALATDTTRAVEAVARSRDLMQAWQAVAPLLSAHEDFLQKSGNPYYFVRNLDRCIRAICTRYAIPDPEIQARLFQWIQLALRVEADDQRLWMLWELALRQSGYPQRAQWVLWEMTRRFPEDLPSRVELARMLADSESPDDQAQAQRLLQQVLQLDPDHLHAHSTIAQLALRREDWTEALTHAQKGLQIDSSDSVSAYFLALAYARRNAPDDLQTAIDHLQRYVTRNPGKPKIENYLRALLQRQASGEPGAAPNHEDEQEQKPASIGAGPRETEYAWRIFADSILSWVAAPDLGDPAASDDADIDLADRLLPLPKALKRTVRQNLWDADILERYDTATRLEFPLETRLWRYLQTLQSDALEGQERDRAKQAVLAWLDVEIQTSTLKNASWIPYLKKYREVLDGPADRALTAGAKWLEDLLDRYQPLPAPLFM